MEAVFLKLLNMSITASYLVIAVVLIRFVFMKAPKTMAVALWVMVGIRLICPFSVKSILSVIPSAETVPQDILYMREPAVDIGGEAIVLGSLAPNPADSVNPMQVIVYIASIVWIAGMAVMILYALISYLRLYRRTRESFAFGDGIRICDHIDTPFILGLIRPHIFLPSSMSEEDLQYVIAHENAHLKRRDHWWKPLGFTLLTVYWYNPIIWLAFILFCRDIEYACDEKVIKELGNEHKKSYSNALINCSIPRKMVNACPLAFGEVGVKRRIKSVLNYKKPSFWIILVSVVVSVGVAVCFMTVPPDNKVEEKKETNFITSLVYANSVDPTMPTITLYIKDNTFRFSFSAYSSYFASGTYQMTDSELILTTDDDFGYVYRFTRRGDDFVFNAGRSFRVT